MHFTSRGCHREQDERDRKEISLAMIVANNHFAEFGPGTTN